MGANLSWGFGVTEKQAAHVAEAQRVKDQCLWSSWLRWALQLALFRMIAISFWLTVRKTWETARVFHALWQNKKFWRKYRERETVCKQCPFSLWGGSRSFRTKGKIFGVGVRDVESKAALLWYAEMEIQVPSKTKQKPTPLNLIWKVMPKRFYS